MTRRSLLTSLIAAPLAAAVYRLFPAPLLVGVDKSEHRDRNNFRWLSSPLNGPEDTSSGGSVTITTLYVLRSCTVQYRRVGDGPWVKLDLLNNQCPMVVMPSFNWEYVIHQREITREEARLRYPGTPVPSSSLVPIQRVGDRIDFWRDRPVEYKASIVY